MTSIDAIVNRQLLKWELERKKSLEEKKEKPAPPRIVTVSRQLGSRGSYFAEKLAERLGFQNLHREVIDAICKSSGYRKRIIESLDEKYRSDIDLFVESFFTGQAIELHDYYRHLFEVVLSMSRLGGVVLVGRAGNFIIGPDRGFHLRFVAPRKKRIENLVKYTRITEAEAEAKIDASDAERKELIAKLFHANNDDPQYYDLIINTGYIDVDDVIESTVKLIETKFELLASQTQA